MTEGSDKILVIECLVCGARFRFDRALFKSAPGARVRCRRCGGSIEVANPDYVMRGAARAAPPRREPGEATGPSGPPVDPGLPLRVGERPAPALPAVRDREEPAPLGGPGGAAEVREEAADREGAAAPPPLPPLPVFLKQAKEEPADIFRLEGPRAEQRRAHRRTRASLVPFLAIALGFLLLVALGIWFLGSPK